MDLLLMLLVTMAFPVGCLFFVLWMGRIEDSLPEAVRQAARKPDPEPVLAIPVRQPAQPVQPVVTIPVQRTEPPVVPAALTACRAGRPRGQARRDLGHLAWGRWPGPVPPGEP